MATSATQSQEEGSRPLILLVSLSFESWHDNVFVRLIDRLSDRAQIKRVRKADVACRFLKENNPKAVIVTDEGVAAPRNATVLDSLVQFARGGGTVVLGFVFSNMIRPADMDALFSRFGVGWKRGGYSRSTFALNRRAIRDLNGLHLSPAYSQKALRVTTDPQNALYLARAESVTESHVFPPTPVDRDETPVAWTKIGEGHLGYVGDVNAEEESNDVVMAMCGF